MPLSARLFWVLLAPGAALLGLVFLLPVAWFLSESLGLLGSGMDILSQLWAIVTSGTIQRSMLVTLQISFYTTVLTLVVGYPIAYGLVQAGPVQFRIIIGCVMLPYFTSIIVRTYAWMVLLGRDGVVNRALQAAGLTDEPLQLLYNRGAVVVGMTYVLLPYMVLTLFSAMRAVDRSLLAAAAGMGASAPRVFAKVFLPLTWHGLAAGCLLVFILAMGFFVTPALMGGTGDLMVGMLIERQVELSNNWPVAAAMSLVLLLVTLAIYAAYSQVAEQKGAVRA